MGTPPFAERILAGLLDGKDSIVGVFARPDAPSGRGLKLQSPPVAQLARERAIPVLQPATWKGGAATDELRTLAPDLVVVAAYGRILPQAALDVPRYGCINVHASLLPRWRGADPITRAILEGDLETGITIMEMVREMDAGAILWQRPLPISPTVTGGELEQELAELGAATLEEAISLWRKGALEAREQDQAAVTFAPMLRKQDGAVQWVRSAEFVARATRAFTPWPGSFFHRGPDLVKLWQATTFQSQGDAAVDGEPGTILGLDSSGIVVRTGEGSVLLREVQAAGKKRMPAIDWARGARIEPGEVLR